MYEQKRREVNKAFEKYEKQLKAAKAKGQSNKQSQAKVDRQQQQKARARGGGGGGKRDGMGGGDDGAGASAPQRCVVCFGFCVSGRGRRCAFSGAPALFERRATLRSTECAPLTTTQTSNTNSNKPPNSKKIEKKNKKFKNPNSWSDYEVHFHFPEPTDLGSASLMQLLDADFKYPGREDFGLKNVNIGIGMGSRVAIVGPNGAGKTTLMNLLSGAPGSRWRRRCLLLLLLYVVGV